MPPTSRSFSPGKEAKKHIAEAPENYEQYQRLKVNPSDTAWSLVPLFYSALHLVQAHALCKCAIQDEPVPESHMDRGRYVSQNLRRIETEYSRLQDASEAVRYELWKPTSPEVEEYNDKEFASLQKRLADDGIFW